MVSLESAGSQIAFSSGEKTEYERRTEINELVSPGNVLVSMVPEAGPGNGGCHT
jgi:hypothetical protein